MPDEPRLEEQALSEAAEMTISTQLDEVENIDVDIRTNLLKMVQGQVESVSIVGQGLVIQQDVRVHEMELHTDSIAINPLSALFGQIQLDQAVDATARLVLTEQDINRALNSDYIRDKFPSWELNVEGQIVTLKPQQLKVDLSTSTKIAVSGAILLQEKAKSQAIAFTAVISPRTRSQPLLLEAFQCTDGQGISLELAIALMHKAKELVNLPFLDWEGMTFRIKELEVQQGKLTVQTEAYVRQIPDFT